MQQEFNEKNRNLVVNINGRLVHRDEAGISPFDSAVQGGDAVWEGLRLYNGRIFKLYEHLDRLYRSAAALSFAEIPPNKKLIAEIKRTLAANQMRDDVHIRLTLTRGEKITSGMDPRLNQSGPTFIILAEHKEPVYAKSGLRLITSKMRRPPPEVLDPKIHHANLLNSILAKIEANNAGADDALMLDLSGHVAETNATHIFLVRSGEVGGCARGGLILRLFTEKRRRDGFSDVERETFANQAAIEFYPIERTFFHENVKTGARHGRRESRWNWNRSSGSAGSCGVGEEKGKGRKRR